jgi:pyrimidine-nucleoside phosphorylase
MNFYDILTKKRYNEELTKKEIDFFVRDYTDGKIPDYQMSAFCMAVCFNGMNDKETAYLTDAMAKSGDMLDLSRFKNLTADKHSTGGVGDKTTLIVAPIVASLGAKVAKMSGRGLGHTGGTVDKLESITGFKSSLSPDDFLKQVSEIGIAVTGQSGNLAPADKKLYALRDVTATVESPALIASSIMSKKIAAGSKNIVLDVKVGSGAFNKTVDDGFNLAQRMVDIGKKCGRNVVAVITNMDTPLGCAVGNNLEVKEAIEVLMGKGDKNLREICLTLASNMIALALEKSSDEAMDLVTDALDSGKAFLKFKEWIKYQGGDVSLIENPENFKKAKYSYDVKSVADGYIVKSDTAKIGLVSVLLGGGREKIDDVIDYCAGIIVNKKVGDKVNKGDVLATLFTDKEDVLKEAEKRYIDAISFGD